MSIRLTCGHCDRKLTAPDNLTGKTVHCPKCRKPITVPSRDAQDDGETYAIQADDQKGKGKKSKPAAPASRREPALRGGDDDSAPLGFEEEKEERKPTIEVRLESGEILSFVHVREVKKLLLAGKLTRHNEARSIRPKPTLADIPPAFKEAPDRGDYLQEMIEQWEAETKWRAIGDGLARDDLSLLDMYEHRFRKWYTRGGVVLFLALWLILGPILVVVFSRWNPEPSDPEAKANPRMKGRGDALAPLVQQVLTPKVVGVGFTLIVLLGVTVFLAIGLGPFVAPLLARACGYDGEPPDDGFEPSG